MDEFLSRTPFVVAHRCGGGHWPEFSRRGVQGSIALGVTALEVSVYAAATGEWACSHDRSTIRVTGIDHDIPTTPWATLRQLRARADHTTDPAQDAAPLTVLADVLANCPPDTVIFLDHKETSSGRGEDNAGALDRERRLLDLLDELPGAVGRVVWKVFAPAQASARRAAERGHPVWGIHYSSTMGAWLSEAEQYDILGLEWNAPPEAWQAITGIGRPVIGHIVASRREGEIALARGAAGLMCSTPRIFADLMASLRA